MHNICSSSTGCAVFFDMTVPYVQLEFVLKASQGGEMPYYSGSVWYHSWARQIYLLSCINPGGKCPVCPYKPGCVYVYLFAGKDQHGQAEQKEIFESRPSPVIIKPPLFTKRYWKKGEEKRLTLTLLGEAVHKVHYFIETLFMIGNQGVGPRKARFEITSIEQTTEDGQSIALYNEDEVLYEKICHRNLSFKETDQIPTKVRIQMVTPLRLLKNNNWFQPFEVDDFLSACYERVRQVLTYYGNHNLDKDILFRPDMNETFSVMKKQRKICLNKMTLSWIEWKDTSLRSYTPQQVGGWQGVFELSGELSPIMPLLWAGQRLHVGQWPEVGLGSYGVESL